MNYFYITVDVSNKKVAEIRFLPLLISDPRGIIPIQILCNHVNRMKLGLFPHYLLSVQDVNALGRVVDA